MDKPVDKTLHPAVAGVLRFFEYDHLPLGPIRDASRDFADFARSVAMHIDPDPELTVALRKLLEAKDAAVRAVVVMEKARLGVDVIPNPSEFGDAR